ncbi:MAG: PAC2 family protein [Acidimicrobiales bacterium]
MSELTWLDQLPLRRPLLLVAFEGIFDAAEAATTALDWICQRSESTRIGEIDPERFFNFQEARPTTRFGPDGQRVIDWPSTEIMAVRTDSPRDLVIMTGVEPHLRWATYSDHIIEVVRRSGCEMVVTVGALVAMVPHTRPFPVTGSAVHPDLARRLNLSQPTYQGPTSLAGVINARLERADVPVISLRVAVPHYVPGPPNPKATRALLRRLEQTTGVSTDYEELDGEVSEWSGRVDQAVASDEESRQYVARLENQVDSNEELLPSGDDLAAELEAFLRSQRRRAGGPDPESGAILPGDEEPDTGPSDSGPSDSGPSDAGPSDAGPSDPIAGDADGDTPDDPDADD